VPRWACSLRPAARSPSAAWRRPGREGSCECWAAAARTTARRGCGAPCPRPRSALRVWRPCSRCCRAAARAAWPPCCARARCWRARRSWPCACAWHAGARACPSQRCCQTRRRARGRPVDARGAWQTCCGGTFRAAVPARLPASCASACCPGSPPRCTVWPPGLRPPLLAPGVTRSCTSTCWGEAVPARPAPRCRRCGGGRRRPAPALSGRPRMLPAPVCRRMPLRTACLPASAGS